MEGGLPIEYGWLIAGSFMLGLEAFGVPGIGFLFAGLAALIVGLLVHFGVIADDNLLAQAAIFMLLTGATAVLLWKKIKRWRTNPNAKDSFSNIIGDMAVVGTGGLRKGAVGQVSWSGTTMMAEIDRNADISELAAASMVRIVAVKGNHLIVAPNQDAT